MLFSMEMIANFMDKLNKTTKIEDNQWRIACAQFGAVTSEKDLSVLYISKAETGEIICENGDDVVVVHDSDIYLVFNTIVGKMNYYNQWELRARTAISKSSDQMHNLHLLAELFPDYIVKVIDPEGRLLFSEGQQVLTTIDPRLIYLLRQTPSCHRLVLGEKGITVFWSGQYYYKHIMLASLHFSDGVYLLFSIMEKDKPITDAEQHLAEIAQEIFGLAEYKSAEGTFSTYSGTFIKLLGGEQVDGGELSRFEKLWGSNINEGAVLIRMELPENDKFTERAMMSSISQKLPTALPVLYRNSILFLMPAGLYEKYATMLGDLAQSAERMTCASLEFKSWNKVKPAYEQIDFVIREKKPEGYAVSCKQYMWDYYLYCAGAHYDEMAPHPDLLKLKAMKGDKDNALLETLYCYLSNNCRMAQVAEELHIHLSTLKYRMSRIQSIISFDPHDYKERMVFLLSYDLMMQQEKAKK